MLGIFFKHCKMMAYNIKNRPYPYIFDKGCYEDDIKTKNVAMNKFLAIL